MLLGTKTIAFSILLSPPMFFFQSAPLPGVLKITSNASGATVTINPVNEKGVVDSSSPVHATTNVSLVVAPGNYQVTAIDQKASRTLNCTTTPATVGPGQTITVSSGQTTNVVCN